MLVQTEPLWQNQRKWEQSFLGRNSHEAYSWNIAYRVLNVLARMTYDYLFQSDDIVQEISCHDREFLQFIVTKEFVSRMYDGTRLKIQRQHPSMSLSQLYFEMDFCKVPMELKWHTDIATMVFSSESERALMETFYQQVIDR